jgi:chromosomal replication initiator protein
MEFADLKNVRIEKDHKCLDTWNSILSDIKEEVGSIAFKSWLSKLSYIGVTPEQEIYLSLPSNFLLEWVRPHYGNKITILCKKYFAGVTSVKIILDESESNSQPVFEEVEGNESIQNNTSPLDPRFNFENFIVGKSNEFAFAAAKRVCESDKVVFNPLFLFGGVGLGKTHLMHAVAWDIQEKSPKRKVVYLSAEKFMYEFVKSLRFKDTMSFKEKFRSVDVLMIDDIQFIAGKESTQEEFFHTFNSLVDQSKQIIISGDRPPSELDGIEERLRSRLSFGVVGEIHKASYELRLSILMSKAEEKKDIKFDIKIIEFLAKKINSNVRELEGAYRRLIAHSELVNRPITIETAKQLLHDLLRANDRRVTVEEIQKKVADYFNIRFNDMVSVRRSRIIARPRQVAMYLSKTHTPKSLPEIGRLFGGRDHTTVMHAVKKVEELCQIDSAFADHIKVLKRSLGI